jgi:glycosyltransferase involved in cell wall biosynthesis
MSRASVLIVQRILPPYRLALFRELCASSQIDVCVAYGADAGASALQSVENPSGVKTERLRNIFLIKGDKLVIQRGLLPLLRSGSLDVIIAEFNLRIVTNLVACIAAKLLGRKFIWWGHGLSPFSGKTSIRLRLLLARAADAMIFYSEQQARLFNELGVDSAKLFVANNAVDEKVIAELNERKPLAQRHRIIYIGRLTPRKNIAVLIRAFAQARGSLPANTMLTIIGNGAELQSLKTIVSELGIAAQVEFIPEIYRETELSPFFNSAWASVSPGSVGLSAIHSLAYGIPMIVAQGVPHGPESAALKENQTTLFFPAGDAMRLSDTIIGLRQDAERHARMSRNSIDIVEKDFSLGAMVNVFEQAVAFVQRKQA